MFRRNEAQIFTLSARLLDSRNDKLYFTIHVDDFEDFDDPVILINNLQSVLDTYDGIPQIRADARSNSLVCVSGHSVPNFSLSNREDRTLARFYEWYRACAGLSADEYSSVDEDSTHDEDSSVDANSSRSNLVRFYDWVRKCTGCADEDSDTVITQDDLDRLQEDLDRLQEDIEVELPTTTSTSTTSSSTSSTSTTSTSTSTTSSSTSSTSRAQQSSTEEAKPTCYDILKKFGRETSLPAFCHCPITMIPFNDPIAVSSGHTFERSALQEYYDSLPDHPKKFPCPVTRILLDKNELKLPAHIVTKNMVEHFTNAVVKEEEAKKKMTEVVTEKQEAVSTASSSQLSASTQSISTDSDKKSNENEKEELREKRVQFFSRSSSATQSTSSNASGAEANTNMRRRKKN